MGADVLMAIVCAVGAKIIDSISKRLRKYMTFVFGMTIISTYFLNDCTIDFVGTMDFGVWLTFVLCFYGLLDFGFSMILKQEV